MTTGWVEIPDGSPFTVDNLPYGVFSTPGGRTRVGVAIGDHVFDLCAAWHDEVFADRSLNRFMAGGRERWRVARDRLRSLFGTSEDTTGAARHLLPQSEVTLHLPFDVADYVDFYSSLHHAENAGRIFRPGGEPLPPNWRHLPVGYHGRAGTVVVSGTPVVRPSGQRLTPEGRPVHGPSQRLDIEAEVGFVVGMPSRPGQPVSTDEFAEHVFGVVLVNDWSARDLQAWESQPLGPFTGKSFATSISPWVVPLDALEAARLPAPPQDPAPLPYLADRPGWTLDLTLEVALNGDVISRPPHASMYWTPAQQLAHLTVNGASLRTGDLYASGTVSGPARDQWGSLLEMTWNGRDPLGLSDGSHRRFLEDGDTVAISGDAPGSHGGRIGLGVVAGTIVPDAE